MRWQRLISRPASVLQFRMLEITPHGTLLVIVPANNCVIFASDGRTTVRGQHVDGVSQKIHTVEGVPNLAFGITGYANFYSECPPLVSMEAWLGTEPNFSGEPIVAEALRAENGQPISEEVMKRVTGRLVYALNEAVTKKVINAVLVPEQCRIVVVQYAADEQVTRVATGLVTTASQVAAVGEVSSEEVRADKRVVLLPMGESDYVNANVFQGYGATLLPQGFWNQFSKERPISSLSETRAAWLAKSLIRATEERTKSLPASTGIGGPITVYSLNGVEPPRLITPPVDEPPL